MAFSWTYQHIKLGSLHQFLQVPVIARLCLSRTSTDLPKKSVFISQCHNVYTNLALEDWFYKNYKFENQVALMLWWNNPCVVIGRHQNPWLEADTKYLKMNNIMVARRNSGGGAVYHDEGNLNCTFFTSRNSYNRKNNLQMLCEALWKTWGIDAEVSARDDIVLHGKKVSGTAAKLGRENAYHHCTLLVDSDKDLMTQSLHVGRTQFETRATESTTSQVTCLSDWHPEVTIEDVMKAIGREFLQGTYVEGTSTGFHLIHPTNFWFHGLSEMKEHLMSWDWIYGMTPDFKEEVSILFPSVGPISSVVTASVHVHKGLIAEVKIGVHSGESRDIHQYQEVMETLKGRAYRARILQDSITNILKGLPLPTDEEIDAGQVLGATVEGESNVQAPGFLVSL
ncbi:unnamed protein product [Darwinula stevensoni]|uniref:BPL/LPL catalytic domain-containing protein n=1 Tax=Darwinula stevensoni TaxID=69355 RepID=A0A7R9A2T1_9CRUS|nr:unnamed protein product [Darwinula stevensoni]CAG0880588.1 unnamed protein product [Darwinula stevensoni]